MCVSFWGPKIRGFPLTSLHLERTLSSPCGFPLAAPFFKFPSKWTLKKKCHTHGSVQAPPFSPNCCIIFVKRSVPCIGKTAARALCHAIHTDRPETHGTRLAPKWTIRQAVRFSQSTGRSGLLKASFKEGNQPLSLSLCTHYARILVGYLFLVLCGSQSSNPSPVS